MIETLAYLVGAVSLLVGAAFSLVGAIGLLRFNDAMTRLHAPTKVGTLGIGSLLLASMAFGIATDKIAFHEVIIMAFLFVTAPISANFIAKVTIHRRACTPPPPPPGDATWATLAPVEGDATPAQSESVAAPNMAGQS